MGQFTNWIVFNEDPVLQFLEVVKKA